MSSQSQSKRFSLSQMLIGRPLETRALARQTAGRFIGLAVSAFEALSSTADATEEISLIPARTGATQAQPSQVVQLLFPDPGLPGLPPARRLLVLVPGPTTLPELANRIWSLAVGAELEVLFIGMAGEGNDEYTIRRLLATLAAATRDRRLRVDTKLVRSKNWLQAIRALWQPGDLIICHSEQTVPGWGFRRRPLAQALVAAFNTPLYVLTGFCPQPPNDEPGVASRWLRSMTPFLIIAGSFVLQVQIEQSFTNGLYYLLMTLSIIIELALLAIWH